MDYISDHSWLRVKLELSGTRLWAHAYQELLTRVLCGELCHYSFLVKNLLT